MSFTSIIRAQRSFVSGIVKKCALNENKNTNVMLIEMLEIVLTPKILGLPEIGGLGLSLFSLMENPRLPTMNFHISAEANADFSQN